MPPRFRAIPDDIKLEPTLARRVTQLREARNLTMLDLCEISKLKLKRIEDIEGGLETWLSTTDRQLLGRALGVEPYMLQEVETGHSGTGDELRASVQQSIVEQIIEGYRDLQCPSCGGLLRCSVQEAMEIDGRHAEFAKAFCIKCPWVLK